MRTLFTLTLAFVTAGLLYAQGMPNTAFEGKNEVLYLDSWGSPRAWSSAECSLSQSEKLKADGRPTLHLHIPVDHFAGEKLYPIGWPRTNRKMALSWEQDWTNFDLFELKIYTEMSRKTVPETPLSLLLRSMDKKRSWNRNLSEIRLGEWVRVSIPISKIKIADHVPYIQFFISESNYKNGDVLDFYIGAFRLVRAAECEVAEMKIRAAAVFHGQPEIDVELDVRGVPAKLSRGIPFTIMRRDEVIRRENLPVKRGRQRLALDISELELEPGDYLLVVFKNEAEKEMSASFRVVEDPWKEAIE